MTGPRCPMGPRVRHNPIWRARNGYRQPSACAPLVTTENTEDTEGGELHHEARAPSGDDAPSRMKQMPPCGIVEQLLRT